MLLPREFPRGRVPANAPLGRVRLKAYPTHATRQEMDLDRVYEEIDAGSQRSQNTRPPSGKTGALPATKKSLLHRFKVSTFDPCCFVCSTWFTRYIPLYPSTKLDIGVAGKRATGGRLVLN